MKSLGDRNLTIYDLSLYLSPAPSTPPPKEEEWSDTPSEVVHLTDSNFDDFIANNPSVLVMFYAPCKYLLFTVNTLGSALQKVDVA